MYTLYTRYSHHGVTDSNFKINANKKLECLTKLGRIWGNENHSHIKILAPFPQITQSLPEKCRLNFGNAIATGNNGTPQSTLQAPKVEMGRGSGRATLAIKGGVA